VLRSLQRRSVGGERGRLTVIRAYGGVLCRETQIRGIPIEVRWLARNQLPWRASRLASETASSGRRSGKISHPHRSLGLRSTVTRTVTRSSAAKPAAASTACASILRHESTIGSRITDPHCDLPSLWHRLCNRLRIGIPHHQGLSYEIACVLVPRNPVKARVKQKRKVPTLGERRWWGTRASTT